jgi:hypothetical protein
VVSEESATLGFGREKLLGMHADHSEICKFDNRDNPRYTQVILNLKKLCDDAIITASEGAAAEAAAVGDPDAGTALDNLNG